MKARKKIIVTILCGLFFSTAAYGTSTIWSWVKDMYNQPSIKPQEEGSFKNFPIGSVTTEGLQISTDGEKHQKATDFSWLATRNIEALAPKNPHTQKSIKKGHNLLDWDCPKRQKSRV